MSSLPLSRQAASLATKRRLRRWSLKQVAEVAGAAWSVPPRLQRKEVEDKPVLGACLDTRGLRAGEVFVALPGAHRDGHEFIGEAQAHGAAACIVRHDKAPPDEEDAGGPLLLVADPEAALRSWGLARRAAWTGTCVGVTGTNGKTTTKDLLALCLEPKGTTHATEGNQNNQLGVPLTLTELSDDHVFAVVEMGMNHPGEIAELASWAKPSCGIITHVGHGHLEGVGSFEGVCRAKAELAATLPEDGFLVIPAGVEALEAALDDLGVGVRRLRFTTRDDTEADLAARDLTSLGAAGVTFRVEDQLVRLRLTGLHNVQNGLAAMLCARELGVSIPDAAAALSRAVPKPGRMEVVTVRGVVLLLDHYNANPESMRAALHVLQSWPARRRLAVLGEMRELGAYRDEGHRAVGEMAHFVDGLYLVGEATAHVAHGAVASGLKEERVRGFSSNAELAAALAQEVDVGDVILLKGSRGAHLEEVEQALRERLGASAEGSA